MKRTATLAIAALLVLMQRADSAREPLRPPRYAVEMAAGQQALASAEANGDETAALEALVALGNVEFAAARPAEAAAYYERALAIQEKQLGSEHTGLTDVLLRLGNTYSLLRTGKRGRAEAAYLRTIAIAEKAYGPAHSEVATRLFTIARFHENRREYPKARYYYERRLAIVEKTFGPEHRSTAATLAALGTISLLEEDYLEAEFLLKRALPILEKDGDVSYYASNLERLADVYAATARPIEAEQLRTRAALLRKG